MTLKLGAPNIVRMDTTINVNAVIEGLGGTSKAAEFFEVQPPSVSEWKARGSMPNARLMYLRAVRPDVYERSTQPGQPKPAAEAA